MTFDWDTLDQYTKTPWPAGYPMSFRSFWAPRDNIHGMLAALLGSVQHSVVLNMFGYDDDELDALIRQHMNDPSIFVQMSLDRSQSKGVHEKEILAKWPAASLGTTIAIGNSVKHAISHLKVCIVDGLYVVRGSTNWSLSGEQKQDNELLLIRDALVAAEARAVLDVNHAEMLKQMAGQAA